MRQIAVHISETEVTSDSQGGEWPTDDDNDNERGKRRDETERGEKKEQGFQKTRIRQ